MVGARAVTGHPREAIKPGPAVQVWQQESAKTESLVLFCRIFDDLLPSALRDSTMISALTLREGKGLGGHILKSSSNHSM